MPGEKDSLERKDRREQEGVGAQVVQRAWEKNGEEEEPWEVVCYWSAWDQMDKEEAADAVVPAWERNKEERGLREMVCRWLWGVR